MAAETNTGFTINGVIYEEPDSLTMGEHRIIKRYTGMTGKQIADAISERVGADQDMLAAAMHIAYRRAHPDLSFEEIEAVVDSQDFVVAMETVGDGEGDELPPDETSEHGNESQPSSLESDAKKSSASGNGSSTDSDPSETNPAPITAGS